MASNRRSLGGKSIAPLTQQDGHFPLGADRLRASYLFTIRKTTAAIRHNDQCTRSDLAYLETQYSSLEKLHARFSKAHCNLMPLLTDSRFEEQEHELFSNTCRDITRALTILRRTIELRKQVENLACETIERPTVASVADPKSEFERLVAANAVLKHRLEVANATESIPMAFASSAVLSMAPMVQHNQPSTWNGSSDAKTVISKRIPPSEKVLEPKRNAANMKPGGNKSGKGTDSRKLLKQRKWTSVVVKQEPATSNKTDTICAFCFEDHKIFRCEKFKNLSLIKRAENVERLRLCPMCLLHERENHRCSKGKSECQMCAPMCHNSLLCPKRYGPNAQYGFNNPV